MSKKHDKPHDHRQVKSNVEIAMEKAAAMGRGAPPETPGGPAAGVAEGELKTLREKAAKADEYYDRLLRTAADFENYRKRMERERSDLVKFGQEQLMADLILVLDNFDRALVAAGSPATADPILDGVKLIQKQLTTVLENNGLQPIEAVGKPFNPEIHEALAQVETDRHPEGTVIAEQLKGYLLNGRLLRPAAVTVAIAKRPAGTDGGETGKATETPR
jgi:molecular chaperone GrpE